MSATMASGKTVIETGSGPIAIAPDEKVYVRRDDGSPGGDVMAFSEVDLNEYEYSGQRTLAAVDGATEMPAFARKSTPDITVIQEGDTTSATAANLAANGSAAARRLAKVRRAELDTGQNRYERVEFRSEQSDDKSGDASTCEVFWIRRLRLSEITRTHLEASRDGQGLLDIREDSDDLRGFTIATLTNTVCADERGTAYFSLKDAAAFVDSFEPEIQILTRYLLNCAIALNPVLLPKLAARAIVAGEPTNDKPEASPDTKPATTK